MHDAFLFLHVVVIIDLGLDDEEDITTELSALSPLGGRDSSLSFLLFARRTLLEEREADTALLM